MPKISVIIPVYRVEPYLRQCVDTVLEQTYRELEIILVDDGSPDGCGAICDEYAEKDSRVLVVHKENGGVSSARNAGLDVATGEWIMFIDSDDVVDCKYAEMMLKAQVETGAELVCCGNDRFSKDADLKLNDGDNDHSVETFSGEEAMENAFAVWYKPNVFGKLINRELFRDVRFPDAKRAEDLWVSYQLLSRCEKLAMMRYYTPYHYRNTPQSAMSNLSARYIEDDLRMRLDSFLSHFVGRYPVTERKLATQTKRIFLDFALTSKSKGDKACHAALQKWGRVLYRQMWKPTAVGLGEKLDYAVLNISVEGWTLLQLVKYKLFNIPLYIE